MSWVTVAAGAASVIGGALGNQQASSAADAAKKQRDQALSYISGLEIPDVEKERLQLEALQYFGDYSPEQLQKYDLGPSAMEQVSVDPLYKQKQLEALERVGQLSKEGITPEERAILELSQRRASAQTQAKINQVLQERQQRGVAGGGDELAAKLAATQQGADLQSQQDMEAAQQMMNTRRQALSQLAEQAGGMRKQEYGEQTDLARARDVINQFNTQNTQETAKYNVGNTNQARMRNLEQQQSIADQNVKLRNQQQEYNKQLAERDYRRRLDKATAMANATSGSAAATQAAGASQGAATAGMGLGIGKIISSLG